MEQAVLKSARLVESDFKSTTRTWEHKPQFVTQVAQSGNDYVVVSGTDSAIFLYVDAGTRPHIIKAKRSKYLAFQGGYRAKTRVGIIGSQEGGAFGEMQYAQQVKHPGTKARKFTVRIQARRQKTIEQEVSQAIAKINRTMK